VTQGLTWISQQLANGQIGFRIGRRGNELVADFVGLGLLCADPSGSSAVFEPAPDADPLAIEKLKNGLVPALLRHLQKELTFHGAAVAIDGRAIVCVGTSGAGKSTLAARLCNTRGAAFLADDTSAVDFRTSALTVLPTERVHWLVSARDAPDPEGEWKYAVTPRTLAESASPLAVVCRVRFDEAAGGVPVVTRLRGNAALEALIPSVIRFAIDDPEAHLREAEQLGELARRVPVFDFVRARGDERALDEAVECLEDLVHRTPGSEP
jgi:hypothetical protein